MMEWMTGMVPVAKMSDASVPVVVAACGCSRPPREASADPPKLSAPSPLHEAAEDLKTRLIVVHAAQTSCSKHGVMVSFVVGRF
jgi:hypothetical protein